MITASTTIKAQFYHLDPMNIVWHGNYVRFFEQARCELLDKIGHNYSHMHDSDYLWPVVDMRAKFVRPVGFSQIIDVEATLREYENRLKIDYLITDAKTKDKVTSGFTIQVAVEKATGEMCFRLPDTFINKVNALLCVEN